MSQSELLACFDSEGNEIEPHVRAEVHAQPLQYWHATNGIWVVNRRGEILCSQRSLTCEGNPGKWQTMFGGHVKAGYDWRESAVAELAEEAGLQCSPDELFLVTKGKSDIALHFSERFMYLFDDMQVPQPADGEVIGFRWLPIEECIQLPTVSPNAWCNTIYPENAKIIHDRLAAVLKST